MDLEGKLNNEILPKPYFEEAALLSARPVVPLAEIRRKARRQRLTFALALAVAVLAGALTTVVVLRFEHQAQPAAVTAANPDNNSEAATNPDPKAVNATVDESAAKPAASAQSKQVDQIKESTSLRTVAKAAAKKREVALDAERVEWESRRKERREAHRARRESRRELRRGERRIYDESSSDDLFRIGEIFEGRRNQK
jgi:hypothetical protein